MDIDHIPAYIESLSAVLCISGILIIGDDLIINNELVLRNSTVYIRVLRSCRIYTVCTSIAVDRQIIKIKLNTALFIGSKYRKRICFLLASSALAGKTADILVVIMANDNSPETTRFRFFDRF
ncbi:hypothetical protein [Ruminococcus albus]|uniref:hypothetical protein n=1 Tax=Ruminococcus albus TaxID=1264 RepID=UPI0011602672|nr:hypothetical protein [Ruminococcus albus]